MTFDSEYSTAKLLAAINDRGITLSATTVLGRTTWKLSYGGGLLHHRKADGTLVPLTAPTITDLRVICDNIDNWQVDEHRWRDEWADRDPWRRAWVVR